MIRGQASKDLESLLFEAADLSEVGRYRDINLEMDNDKLVIWLLTRNGGGNRECSGGDDCNDECCGCVQENILPLNPNYIRDQDCDWDCTYAETYFCVPDKYKEQCQKIWDDRMTKKRDADDAQKNIDDQKEMIRLEENTKRLKLEDEKRRTEKEINQKKYEENIELYNTRVTTYSSQLSSVELECERLQPVVKKLYDLSKLYQNQFDEKFTELRAAGNKVSELKQKIGEKPIPPK